MRRKDGGVGGGCAPPRRLLIPNFLSLMAYSHPCICLAFDVFVIHALLGELLFREDKEKKKKDTPTTSTDYLCSTVASCRMDGYPKVI